MEDAVKVLSAKFDLTLNVLQQIGNDSVDVASWLTVLGAYVLDNDKKQEEHAANEILLRKQRLNAEHQLSQLEKQLISANTKLSKYEKNLLATKTRLEEYEESTKETEQKYGQMSESKQKFEKEYEQVKQKLSHVEQEKQEFAEVLEKKNREIDRLNEEWNEMSTKLAAANKVRYELKYKLDEIKNSDIRKEFKEKRLEQEKSMLLRQMEQMTVDLKIKTNQVNELNRDKTEKLLSLENKCDSFEQENLQLKSSLETSKKVCTEQEAKIENLLSKSKRAAEEHIEVENNMQQELTAQNKLVQLYKDDRDHAKKKLEEVTTAITELQSLLKQQSEEKSSLQAKLTAEEESNITKINELEQKIEDQALEIQNANDLLQVTKKRGSTVMSDDLSILSPVAAATSKILKKGMTLTQIYSEYVKVTDELLSEKDENARLKLYMEQILQEVEEKAPLLMQQKEDYVHARRAIDNMSIKMEENIKECHRLQNEHSEYERKVNFHKREEKRLKTLCIDLSQQVRVLLKEVEEARGGSVSSSATLSELLPASEDLNTSSSGQVISEHLVTFKSIEELQAQNERLLLTVRELSEEQEKLEQEGGPEIIHELKKKIENANFDLDVLRDNQRTQDEMLERLSRQRDMYKVLCQKGGVMVGDVSSTSVLGSESILETEAELTKTKAELDITISEHMKLKEEVSKKEKSLNETINSREEQLSSIRLERDRLKNQFDFAEEKYSILATTADSYKKEVKAIEAKCTSITDALTKVRIEAAKYKQEYNEAHEKLIAAEVNVKSMETEKHLVKEAEKRLMQENQSLLDQQRSQNALLTNLQTIQNNLERQEFETRKVLGKQVDTLQREVRALRRQNDNESHLLKSTNAALEKENKELKIKLGVEMEKSKHIVSDAETSKQLIEQLETKCKELESISKATEARLASVLEREANGSGKEDYLHEIERYKTKVRELEQVVSSVVTEKKAIEDQLEVAKKHSQQYEEIANSNEQAISIVNEKLDTQCKDYEKKLTEANEKLKKLGSRITAVVAEKVQMKKSSDQMEKKYQSTIADLRTQAAPLERRFQEVTRALVQAKEMETAAVKESHGQVEIAKEMAEKYERELVLHAKDVEQLTLVKGELQASNSRYGGMEEKISEMKHTLENNERLLAQMKEHHSKELRKGELTRKDLIDQNAILHGQVEKLSAQLAAAKSQERSSEGQEFSSDKAIEEVYELLRFVRREKEIAETKSEASETESMRYRQRAEHLQRDLDETKAALEMELERTKGRMLTEVEHKDIMEKVKKAKEYEELNTNLEKQKAEQLMKTKLLMDKNKRLEADLKPLQENKKTLEGEKNAWLAEKTALKAEIERWTNRTNQLMAQSAKSDAEEVKKLQAQKLQNDKTISALQDDLRRTKQQLDAIRRESLRLKAEKTESQNKISSLQSELTASKNTANKPPSNNENENTELDVSKKELEEVKKSFTRKTTECQQLRKLAKKYKTLSDKLQKLLTEHNIDFSAVSHMPMTDAIPTPSQATIDPEDKKKLEDSLAEKIKLVEDLTKQLTNLQMKYDDDIKSNSEKEGKLQESQNRYAQAEKEIATLKSELNDEKEKQEKNKKLVKTAKDKINSLSKLKETKNREVETLKKSLEEVIKQLEKATEQSTTHNSTKEEFEKKIHALENRVEELMNDKASLTESLKELQSRLEKLQSRLEKLQSRMEKMQQEKANKKFLKAAGQQKSSRLQSATAGSSKANEAVSTSDTSSAPFTTVAPLTATVRPSATPTQHVSKVHPQIVTPTASIRPLAHAAPTAMISPTPVTISAQPSMPVAISMQASIPGTQSTPVASVSALPITAPVTPQVAEVQGRTASSGSRIVADRPCSFKAPVARVSVQVQEREDVSDTVPNIDDEPTSEPGPSTSSDDTSRVPTSKRTHADLEGEQEDEEIVLLESGDSDEPGVKRQRVEEVQTETDSQEGIAEDELLDEATEDGDDDAMEPATDTVPSQGGVGILREAQLQIARNLQPSPQELLRQRSLPRGRAQLPSFSLMPGQGNVGYYEDTDDSTVPSTPTLYMPKRTDGFAEAVSSPLVRFPTFSFASNEQPSETSNTPALEQTSVHLDETRVDLISAEDQVPQTPLSIVPSTDQLIDQTQVTLSQVESEEHESYGGQFFQEDNGQEQNVPQQIDLTEDEEDDNEDIPEDAEDVEDDDDEEEVEEEEAEAKEDDISEKEDDDSDEPVVVDSEDDSDSSEPEEPDEEAKIEEEYGDEDVVEIDNSGENEFDEDEEKENVTEESVAEEKVIRKEEEEKKEEEEEKTSIVATNVTAESSVDITGEESSSAFTEQAVAASSDEQMQDQAKVEEVEKPKPVRLQRTSGMRPRLRRTALPGQGRKPDNTDKPS